MTFTALVTEVTSRLNLTSAEASTRVGRLVNKYYSRAATSIGIAPMTRRLFDIAAQATIGSAEFDFDGLTQITRVWYEGSDGTKQFLDIRMVDELRDETPLTCDTPSRYAIKQLDASTVVILVDAEAVTDYYLYADGYGQGLTLSGTDEPAFPEDFHDLLVEGVLKDEYKKMEKIDLAKESMMEYESRLSALRMWGAKQAYLRLQQGGRPRTRRTTRDTQGAP